MVDYEKEKQRFVEESEQAKPERVRERYAVDLRRNTEAVMGVIFRLLAPRVAALEEDGITLALRSEMYGGYKNPYGQREWDANVHFRWERNIIWMKPSGGEAVFPEWIGARGIPQVEVYGAKMSVDIDSGRGPSSGGSWGGGGPSGPTVTRVKKDSDGWIYQWDQFRFASSEIDLKCVQKGSDDPNIVAKLFLVEAAYRVAKCPRDPMSIHR